MPLSPVVQRIVTATVLVATFLPALFLLPQLGWNVVCIAIAVVCAKEWGALCGFRGLPNAVAIIAVASGMVILMLQSELQLGLFLVASVIWIMVVPLLLWQNPQKIAPSLRLTGGGIVILAAALALSEIRAQDSGLLLSIMAIVWISDSAAYFSGKAWGRHKLASSISPGKTWEGVFGAMIAVLAYAVILYVMRPELAVPWWGNGSASPQLVILVWPFLAIAGIVGDLAESWAKRVAGVKDSGSILPGHGGLLDRVDALLPVLPFAALIYLR